MNSSYSSNHPGAIHYILHIILMQLILFFKSSWCKIASAAENWINSATQAAATTLPSLRSLSFFYAWPQPGATLDPPPPTRGLSYTNKHIKKCTKIKDDIKMSSLYSNSPCSDSFCSMEHCCWTSELPGQLAHLNSNRYTYNSVILRM